MDGDSSVDLLQTASAGLGPVIDDAYCDNCTRPRFNYIEDLSHALSMSRRP